MDGCYLALALCAALTDRRAGRHLPLERSFQEATVDHVSMGAEKVHVLRMNFNNTPSPPPTHPAPHPAHSRSQSRTWACRRCFTGEPW